MIRMCDTMQTWKWGGFGLGWQRGGGGGKRLRTPARQAARSAVPLGAQPSKPPCVFGEGGGEPVPRALPAGGAIGRGCDGGTAAVASLAVRYPTDRRAAVTVG